MKIESIKSFIVFSTLASIAIGLLGGCQKAPPPAPAAPEVTVELPVTKQVYPFFDFTGNTAAFEEVDIRARVTGFLEEIHFKDGDDVKEGDVLFTIEQDVFKATVAQAEAVLEANKAELERAGADLARVEKAVKTGAVSEQEVDLKRAERNVAKAAVAKAEASLDQANLQLSYTKVTSPISGRVSRTLVDPGNLVGPGETTLLTRVVNLDPMYVYSNISERLLVDILQRVKEKTGQENKDNVEIFVGLVGDEGYPHKGKLNFFDNILDQETGTVQIRGVLPNDSGLLYPGMFVRMRIPQKKPVDAILVKEIAIGTDLGGKFLLVVDDQNMVQRRYIETGQQFDDLRVVKDSTDPNKGMKANDRYIVKGLQRARPGRPVTPKTANETAADATDSTEEK